MVGKRCPTCGRKVQPRKPRPRVNLDALQACRLLSQGLTVKEVAAQMGARPSQVHEAVERLRDKRQCKTTYQLMAKVAGELGGQNG